MSALLLELLSNFRLERSVDNYRLLRSAYRAVIEARPGQNIANRLRCIRGPFYEYRHIAGTDTKRRFARRVRGANKADPTGRENYGGLVRFHTREHPRPKATGSGLIELIDRSIRARDQADVASPLLYWGRVLPFHA